MYMFSCRNCCMVLSDENIDLLVGDLAVRFGDKLQKTYNSAQDKYTVTAEQWCIGGYTRVYGIYQPPGFFDSVYSPQRS